MKTQKNVVTAKDRFKEIAMECLKMKLIVSKVGTWIWIDSVDEEDKMKFLTSKGFQFSKNKNKFFLKGYDAVQDWGNYTPVKFDSLFSKYKGERLNSKNLNKILN